LVGAIIVVAIFMGALGTYFFVLAPSISIVDWSHTDSNPWQHVFTVTVKNSGKLTGNATIVCEYSFMNSTRMNTFNGTLSIKLKGGEQAQYQVTIALSLLDGVSSLVGTDKSWNVRLA